MFVFILSAVVAVDRLTKQLVRNRLLPGQSIGVFGRYLDWTYVQNTGAAFSILQGKTVFLLAFSLLTLVAVSIYTYHHRHSMPLLEKVAWSLVAGGGLGNMIDRFFYGYVVDFINIHLLPVFNVADMAVCAGCAFLLFSYWSEGR